MNVFVPPPPPTALTLPSKKGLTLEDRAREYSDIAMDALVEIACDLDCPPAARISAAKEILDRGHGRPLQNVKAEIDFTTIVKRLSAIDVEFTDEED